MHAYYQVKMKYGILGSLLFTVLVCLKNTNFLYFYFYVWLHNKQNLAFTITGLSWHNMWWSVWKNKECCLYQWVATHNYIKYYTLFLSYLILFWHSILYKTLYFGCHPTIICHFRDKNKIMSGWKSRTLMMSSSQVH